MKTKREILAAILEGNIEPLLKYRDQKEGCIYVFNCFSENAVAYYIYPDLTVEVKAMTNEAVFAMMRQPSAEGFEIEYHDDDLEELKEDLQKNPERYYERAARHFYA